MKRAIQTGTELAILMATLLGIGVYFYDFLAGQGENSLLLLAIPLLYFMVPSWKLKESFPPLPMGNIAVSTLLIGAGFLTEFMLLSAIGFSLLASTWLVNRLENPGLSIYRVGLFLLLVLPWIEHDFQKVGWIFRISAADLTDEVFSGLGFMVIRQGVNLYINGIRMEVAASCAGLGTLQLFLMASIYLAAYRFPKQKMFWMVAILSIPLAWAANFCRILLFTAISLAVNVEFVQGSFHEVGGMSVIFLFLVGWYLFLGAIPSRTKSEPAIVPERGKA